jgi:hypothetical protein
MAAAGFLSSRGGTFALVTVIFASLRIPSIYTVLNQTIDEPLHIPCVIDWLGSVICADETPPLARVAESIGPYLLDARSKDKHIAAWTRNTMPAPGSYIAVTAMT